MATNKGSVLKYSEEKLSTTQGPSPPQPQPAEWTSYACQDCSVIWNRHRHPLQFLAVPLNALSCRLVRLYCPSFYCRSLWVSSPQRGTWTRQERGGGSYRPSVVVGPCSRNVYKPTDMWIGNVNAHKKISRKVCKCTMKRGMDETRVGELENDHHGLIKTNGYVDCQYVNVYERSREKSRGEQIEWSGKWCTGDVKLRNKHRGSRLKDMWSGNV